MNIKILGLSLTIASCLSLSLVSCDNKQPKSSTTQTSQIDPDRLSPKLDRVPGSVAALSGSGTKIASDNAGFSGSGEQERIRLFEKSKDAVVKIKTSGATGSGFIVSKDGLIVTNKHVVQNDESQIADKVIVIFADGTEIEANVLGASRHRDLALIRIPNQSRLKFLNFAKSETIKVGQNVYALGSPFGIENVFTAGVLNKIDKSDSKLYHDARINHGNSGGPLLNSRGEVIGINTSLVNGGGANDTSISSAINIDRVGEVIADYKGKRNNFVSINNVDKRTKLVQLPITGQAIAGRFQAEDETDERNVHYHAYSFQGQAEREVTIEMNSSQIDPVLALYFIDEETKQPKEVYANSGVSPQDANAKISIVLPKDGTYIVIAKTFQPKETGNYQIKATLK
jgi:serine protease Do